MVPVIAGDDWHRLANAGSVVTAVPGPQTLAVTGLITTLFLCPGSAFQVQPTGTGNITASLGGRDLDTVVLAVIIMLAILLAIVIVFAIPVESYGV